VSWHHPSRRSLRALLVEAACGRALFARSYSYRSVESILKTGLDKQPLLQPAEERKGPSHENLRGPGYYR
jgi:hypothetical protein